MLDQPKGLWTIASTEMWERFSFYTMQYSLVLYATATIAKGGMGFSDNKALQIVGIYGGLAYSTPVFGGYIADKFIGRKNAIHLGGILMAIGHFILALNGVFNFYLSLIFLALGCGLFKPNIASLVGNLYAKHDEKREAGYNIFYSGINIGALLSGIIGGVLNNKLGYYASFVAAGICMLVGLTNFKLFSKNIQNIDNSIQSVKIKNNPIPFLNLGTPAKNGVYLFIILSIMNIVWQIAYNQWAGLLNLYAERNTDRIVFGYSIPTLWFESFNSFFIVTLSPLLALFYVWLQKINFKFDLSLKLALGYFLQAIACFVIIPAVMHIQVDSSYKASPCFQIFFYLFSTLAELFTIPVMYSATSLLAPKGYEGRLMGFYIFTALSMGTYLAGFVGSFISKIGDAKLFLCLGIVTFIFGVIHLLLNKKINYFTLAAIRE